MCGRFSDLFTWAELHALYSIHDQPAPNLPPRYNFAPKQFGAVVRLTASGERELVKMRWGLVPGWAKDDKLAFKTINARCETVATSPAFRGAYKQRFALKPVSSFFEWPKGQNPRLFTTAPPADPAAPRSPTGGEPFAFAALWESWRPKDAASGEGEELLTFTIITGEPNDHVRPYHDRMPVMLQPKDWAAWLSKDTTPEERRKLLAPYPAEKMVSWAVDKRVGNVRNEDAEIVKKIGD